MSIISDFYDRESSGHEAIFLKLSVLPDDTQIFMSILSLYELEYGYANANELIKSTIRAKIIEAQEDFEVLPLSRDGAKIFGEIKQLFKEKRKISSKNIKKHNIDLMFAAEALVHNCILVSADRIFKDVLELNPELKLENWLSNS